MNCNLIAVAAFIATSIFRTNAIGSTGPAIIGPGPHSLLYVTSNSDVHVLQGTEIISPSLTGPPEDFVVVTDAIEFRGGGHIQIDGGYFRGGDASYTGANGSLATVAAGEALHLRQSSGEVYGGTFIGGQAFSTTWLGSTSGGDGLILVESEIEIFDGYFEGGVSTEPEFLGGGLRVIQAPGINAYSGSNVIMHGGQVNGEIHVRQGASLSIFGTDLKYEGAILSGVYDDGTPFSHSVPYFGGRVLFNTVVPEPSTAIMIVAAGMMWPFLQHRQRVQLRG